MTEETPRRPSGGSASTAPAATLSERIAHNVSTIAAILEQEREASSTPAQRGLERLSRFIGQPAYFITLLTLIAAWVLFNTIAPMLGVRALDRPPFQGLQGILTLVALLTSTIVVITQNRGARLEQQRAHLDLQINLLTEQKVTRLIALLEELRRDLPMVRDRDDPHTALQEATDSAQVISALKEAGVSAQDEPPKL